MKLNKYMPPFLSDVREFQEIFASEDEELEMLNSLVKKMLNEVIVKNANSYGLDRYEKIYNINTKSDNIEERRFVILNKINDKIPYTVNWLRNKLRSLVGEDNYRIILKHTEYCITIEVAMLFENIANTLSVSLREQLPANLQIIVNLFQTENAKIYYGDILRQGDYMKIGGME